MNTYSTGQLTLNTCEMTGVPLCDTNTRGELGASLVALQIPVQHGQVLGHKKINSDRCSTVKQDTLYLQNRTCPSGGNNPFAIFFVRFRTFKILYHVQNHDSASLGYEQD